MPTVDELNRLPEEAVRQALRGCCSSGRWIDAVAARRPFDGTTALLAASDAAVAGLTDADLRDALAGHPRIGDRGAAGWSGQEQALDEGNAEYEQRFGHIYLASATGRSASELLAFLHERLGNDQEKEWDVVRSELAKINQIRLRKLTGDAL